jgi:hypothetical protein
VAGHQVQQLPGESRDIAADLFAGWGEGLTEGEEAVDIPVAPSSTRVAMPQQEDDEEGRVEPSLADGTNSEEASGEVSLGGQLVEVLQLLGLCTMEASKIAGQYVGRESRRLARELQPHLEAAATSAQGAAASSAQEAREALARASGALLQRDSSPVSDSEEDSDDDDDHGQEGGQRSSRGNVVAL